MRVAPRRYAVCVECSKQDGGEFITVKTLQWLREMTVSQSRGCFGPRGVSVVYVCEQCGSENHG